MNVSKSKLLFLGMITATYCESGISKSTSDAKPTSVKAVDPKVKASDSKKKTKSMPKGKIVATVMGVDIPENLIYSLMSNQVDISKITEAQKSELFDHVLESMINNILIKELHEAEFKDSEEYKIHMLLIQSQIISQLYLNTLMSDKTDEDIKNYYENMKNTDKAPMLYKGLVCNCKDKAHANEIIKLIQDGSSTEKALLTVNKTHKTTYKFRSLIDENGNDLCTVMNIKTAANGIKSVLNKEYDHAVSNIVHGTAIQITDQKTQTSEYAVLYIEAVTVGTKDDFPAYSANMEEMVKQRMLKAEIQKIADANKNKIVRHNETID